MKFSMKQMVLVGALAAGGLVFPSCAHEKTEPNDQQMQEMNAADAGTGGSGETTTIQDTGVNSTTWGPAGEQTTNKGSATGTHASPGNGINSGLTTPGTSGEPNPRSGEGNVRTYPGGPAENPQHFGYGNQGDQNQQNNNDQNNKKKKKDQNQQQQDQNQTDQTNDNGNY